MTTQAPQAASEEEMGELCRELSREPPRNWLERSYQRRPWLTDMLLIVAEFVAAGVIARATNSEAALWLMLIPVAHAVLFALAAVTIVACAVFIILRALLIRLVLFVEQSEDMAGR